MTKSMQIAILIATTLVCVVMPSPLLSKKRAHREVVTHPHFTTNSACGFAIDEYDSSYMSPGRLIEFNNPDPETRESYCGATPDTIGCWTDVTFDNTVPELTRIPVGVWYYLEDTEGDHPPLVKLYFNFDYTAMHLAGVSLCDGATHTHTISKCMFNAEWIRRRFDVFYTIAYDVTCSYDSLLGVNNLIVSMIVTPLGVYRVDSCTYGSFKYVLVSYTFEEASYAMVPLGMVAPEQVCDE